MLKSLCTLGYGLTLTYGARSLCRSAKTMLPLGLGSNLEFFQQKSYSDRLLVETSSELSCTVTRRQFGEIWVLWGELLIINGSDYLLLGLFLQGNLGITSHWHRLKRVSVCDLCGDFFPLTGAEAKAIFKVFSQSVCLSSISFFLWFPSPCFALWVPSSPSFTLPTALRHFLALPLLSFTALVLPPTLLLSQVLLTIVPSFSFPVFSFPL